MPIVNGKTGLQRRKARHDGWTKERRATFLDALATTCHAGHAAAAAGASARSARWLRQRDAEFALLWAAAIMTGRERLKEELLFRSLGQLTSGDNPGAERHEPGGAALPPFDADEARKTLETLAKLERTQPRDRGRPDYATDAEVTHLLAERLAALAKRLARS